MITRTSLNAQVVKKIDAAMRRATHLADQFNPTSGAVVDVTNARGGHTLRVVYLRGTPQAFRFYTVDARDITALVLQVLRGHSYGMA